MRVPAHWWTDQVSVEPFLGDGAHGPVYGPPVVVLGQLEQSRRVTAGSDGTDVVSETVLRFPPSAVDVITEQARVSVATVPPVVARVMTVRRHAVFGQLVYLDATIQ